MARQGDTQALSVDTSERENVIDIEPNDTRKPKIPLVDVDCSDLEIFVGFQVDEATGEVTNKGTAFKVHVGEIVSLIPVGNMADQISMSTLTSFAQRQEKIGPDGKPLPIPPEDLKRYVGSLESICETIAERIYSWTWTDIMGEPLEQPYKNPHVIQKLTPHEVFFLLARIQSPETKSERKNE